MANIKSAKKRILVTQTKTARNKAIKSKVKTLLQSLKLIKLLKRYLPQKYSSQKSFQINKSR